jgi:hypothetical protein
MQEIHVGDVGTALRATIRNQSDEIVDVSAATTLELHFVKPDRTRVTQTATLYSDGTDGIIEYITETDDLDQAGFWNIQGYVVISGAPKKSNVDEFRVFPNVN